MWVLWHVRDSWEPGSPVFMAVSDDKDKLKALIHKGEWEQDIDSSEYVIISRYIYTVTLVKVIN